VKERLGLDSLEAVNKLVEQNRLLALPTSEGIRHPEFQLIHGKLNPIVATVLKSKDNDLDDHSPVEWLELGRDPSIVIELAEETAADLEYY
jgi:hypothetical protein